MNMFYPSFTPALYQLHKVLTPPDSVDLLTIDAMRSFLSMTSVPITATDPQLALIITQTSASMATSVNRVFGFQEVQETFFHATGQEHLYVSKSWPIKFDDIESLTLNGVDILNDTDWALEESTGTFYRPGGWQGTIDCVYSGGYHLPDEAPPDLQKAASVIIAESYYTFQRGMLATGVRMLSHKGARIQFMQPTTAMGKGAAGGTPAWNAAQATLDHYFRHWMG